MLFKQLFLYSKLIQSPMEKILNLQKLLCMFGFHKVEIIDVKYGFGVGGSTEKVKCKQCGKIYIRPK